MPFTDIVGRGKIWTCKIGASGDVPSGGDFPMRQAIEKAYLEVTGEEPDFIFSGWGGSLNEGEWAVVENRLPDPDVIASEAFEEIDNALDRWNDAKHVSEGLPQ